MLAMILMGAVIDTMRSWRERRGGDYWNHGEIARYRQEREAQRVAIRHWL